MGIKNQHYQQNLFNFHPDVEMDYVCSRGPLMLEIRPIMNSSAEEILAFKTCCSLKAWDQNLEIMVKNNGDRPVVVPSFFDLEGDEGMKRVDTLMPNGEQRIKPGRLISFYCFMDEQVWKRAKRLVFFDTEGNRYPIEIGPLH